MEPRIGILDAVPAIERLDLVAEPVAAALTAWSGPEPVEEVGIAEIDPGLADTAAFCERYGVRLDESANCVVVAARRGGDTRLAACVVLATTRADVNGLVRRHLDARRASFAPLDAAVAASPASSSAADCAAPDSPSPAKPSPTSRPPPSSNPSAADSRDCPAHLSASPARAARLLRPLGRPGPLASSPR
jgi:hypothetical protein